MKIAMGIWDWLSYLIAVSIMKYHEEVWIFEMIEKYFAAIGPDDCPFPSGSITNGQRTLWYGYGSAAT